ncbi:MAG: class D sortase [Aminipila sp.]
MKRISTWLIIIGLVVCLIPIGGRLYMNYKQDKMYKEYLQVLEEQNLALTNSFNEEVVADSLISQETTTATEASITSPAPVKKIENIIGRISIPSISSDQLLLEGSSTQQLKYGAGHITGTALPGEIGNCSIAGHRNYTFGSYFNRLDEVNIGDSIVVDYNNTTYTYIVTESLIVNPDDVSVLMKTPDTATITLITCHPKGSNTQRLIVKGSLK